MAEVGEKCSHELALKVVGEILGKYIGRSFALFDDVLPTMKALKQQDFTLGILTNLSRDMVPVCHDLGLDVCLDFIVTSKEAGANKPAPPMFLMALEKSGVKPAEAVHVGDQYKFDVLGARAVGINPVLIDRFDIYPDIRDCPRIRDLSELPQHLG
jgi:putative hydrolase of the HAD superfamily